MMGLGHLQRPVLRPFSIPLINTRVVVYGLQAVKLLPVLLQALVKSTGNRKLPC